MLRILVIAPLCYRGSRELAARGCAWIQVATEIILPNNFVACIIECDEVCRVVLPRNDTFFKSSPLERIR
jgi:hypothetical protein